MFKKTALFLKGGFPKTKVQGWKFQFLILKQVLADLAFIMDISSAQRPSNISRVMNCQFSKNSCKPSLELWAVVLWSWNWFGLLSWSGLKMTMVCEYLAWNDLDYLLFAALCKVEEVAISKSFEFTFELMCFVYNDYHALWLFQVGIGTCHSGRPP